MTISTLLAEGKQNARTGRELAEIMGCSVRELAERIESERRQGVPICASTKDKKGYFLPANNQELQTYCDSLDRRERALRKTRKSLVKILRKKQNQGE